MKKVFLNCILLLCALIVGSGSLWADDPVYTLSFSQLNTGTNYNSYTGAHDITVSSKTWSVFGNQSLGAYLRVGGKNTTNTNRTLTSQAALSAAKAIGKVVINHSGTGAGANTTITINSIKVEGSTSSSFTTSKSKTISNPSVASAGNLEFTLDDGNWDENSYFRITVNYVTAKIDASGNGPNNSYITINNVKFYEAASGSTTFSVTYDGNGNTSGAVPTDATAYASGALVTVLDNTGSLAKTYCTFGGWNTKSDGTGTNYTAGNTFTISTNTTLYAKWTDTRSSAGLVWSAASADVTYGADNNVFPTLTNTHSVAVTYSSSNQAAATIDGSGVITLKDYTGSTTISAIFAGNDDYLPQTVTYTLNVTKAPFSVKDGVFDFVEAAKQEPIEDYGSGATLSSSSYTTGEVTWTAGNVVLVTDDGGGNGFRWWPDDGTLRLYNKSTASFSVPTNYSITCIETTGANFNSIVSGGGSLSGSKWYGLSQTVTLSVNDTRKFKTFVVTYTKTTNIARTAEGYSTFYTPCKVEFTSTGTLKVYKGVLDGTTMNLYQYSNNVIPANTAVVLKSDADITVAASSSEAGVAGGDESSLTGTLTQKDASTVTGGTLCVLGQHEGTSGFYAFTGETLAANKAYLVIPTASAPSIHFVINEENNATSIEAISATDKVVKFIENGQIFIKRDGIVYDALGRIAK